MYGENSYLAFSRYQFINFQCMCYTKTYKYKLHIKIRSYFSFLFHIFLSNVSRPKLCKFIYFKMFSNVVVMIFAISSCSKILSIHCSWKIALDV